MNVPVVEGDGYGFEYFVLGRSCRSVDRKYRQGRPPRFRDAVRQVMDLQRELGFDPCHPKTFVIRVIFNYIDNRLRWAGLEGKLLFFTSVGTYLDILGVDCFFRFGGQNVTMDLYSGRLSCKGSGQSGPLVQKNRANIILSRQHLLADDHLRIAEEITQRFLTPK